MAMSSPPATLLYSLFGFFPPDLTAKGSDVLAMIFTTVDTSSTDLGNMIHEGRRAEQDVDEYCVCSSM